MRSVGCCEPFDLQDSSSVPTFRIVMFMIKSILLSSGVITVLPYQKKNIIRQFDNLEVHGNACGTTLGSTKSTSPETHECRSFFFSMYTVQKTAIPED